MDEELMRTEGGKNPPIPSTVPAPPAVKSPPQSVILFFYVVAYLMLFVGAPRLGDSLSKAVVSDATAQVVNVAYAFCVWGAVFALIFVISTALFFLWDDNPHAQYGGLLLIPAALCLMVSVGAFVVIMNLIAPA